MPGSPQRNTRVGKRPRAFPEWRGVPVKHHTHGHRVTGILPGFSLWSRVKRGAEQEHRCGRGVVGEVGQCQGKTWEDRAETGSQKYCRCWWSMKEEPDVGEEERTGSCRSCSMYLFISHNWTRWAFTESCWKLSVMLNYLCLMYFLTLHIQTFMFSCTILMKWNKM